MKCPYCREDDDRVTDSRIAENGYAIRRRRQCNRCGKRFTTYERVERRRLKVVKKDGSRVPYDRNKIKTGLEKACWKRPISDEQIESIVTAIEDDIEKNFENEVESRYIGELAMKYLRELDQVAYVRFASVYRQFEDVHDFMEEVRPMLDQARSG
ncbi:MAG: transcriptional regulator NrdR [Thermogutta sp.]|nr:transcriptional regulator NrdR [Thermogutta sp.]HOP76416.1 transcriptional regulator NrdR [Thermogutta sp.]HPU04944.1 transcriptional regulator NrdR [Thermogutta sp.]HQF13406.1 transcriptional regulator NrdR [Thermogutta sp.]